MTKIDVRHVARLARIRLTEEEVLRLEEDLGTILEHVSRLAEVNVRGVPPTFGTGQEGVRLAQDVPGRSLKRGRVLDNAPSREKSYIKVPREGTASGDSEAHGPLAGEGR